MVQAIWTKGRHSVEAPGIANRSRTALAYSVRFMRRRPELGSETWEVAGDVGGVARQSRGFQALIVAGDASAAPCTQRGPVGGMGGTESQSRDD